MRRQTVFACALLAMLAVAAGAAEKAPTTRPAVKFKLLEAPYAVEILQADPILTEGMKYVAVVRARLGGWGPVSLEDQLRHWVENTPREHQPSEEIRSFLMTQSGRAIRHTMTTRWRVDPPGVMGVSPRAGTRYDPADGPGYAPSAGSPGAYTRPPVRSTRTPARPSVRPGVDARGGMGADVMRPRAGPAPRERPAELPIHQFLILAPTRERAEQLVGALITVYDHGWAYPQQQLLRQAAENERARLPDLRARLTEVEKRFAEVKAKVDKHEDIGAEGLSALKSEKWLLAVRLEGIKARFDMAERILQQERDRAKARNEPSVHVPLLEKAIIDGRIELAGLLAREAKADQLIASAIQREALEVELLKADRPVSGSKSDVERCQWQIAAYEQDAESELHAPFKLLGDAVAIHPIKWVKPPPRQPTMYDMRGGYDLRRAPTSPMSSAGGLAVPSRYVRPGSTGSPGR